MRQILTNNSQCRKWMLIWPFIATLWNREEKCVDHFSVFLNNKASLEIQNSDTPSFVMWRIQANTFQSCNYWSNWGLRGACWKVENSAGTISWVLPRSKPLLTSMNLPLSWLAYNISREINSKSGISEEPEHSQKLMRSINNHVGYFLASPNNLTSY